MCIGKPWADIPVPPPANPNRHRQCTTATTITPPPPPPPTSTHLHPPRFYSRSFCHNGDMMMMDDALRGGVGDGGESAQPVQPAQPSSFSCVGDTDSELFFTTLLNHLKRTYPDEPPPLDALFETVRDFARAACERDEGAICNFLLSAGEGSLFAFSWPGARPGSKCWNGPLTGINKPHRINGLTTD